MLGRSRIAWIARIAIWVATTLAVGVQMLGGSSAWGVAGTAGLLFGVAVAARPLLDLAASPLTHLAREYTGPGFFAAVSWGLGLERAAQIGSLVAALVLESVGPQEYDIRTDDFTKRFADSYGDEAAADIKPFLP